MSFLTLEFAILFLKALNIGILSQVWYLIESIPDLCRLSYFKSFSNVCIILVKRVSTVL